MEVRIVSSAVRKTRHAQAIKIDRAWRFRLKDRFSCAGQSVIFRNGFFKNESDALLAMTYLET